ncbi:hypothetical protein [Thiomicrospira sp. ALE5]|uniref:hypothetical protein n=1 Tax=Thiomicrospira sp. ALE5 TaxID=748650 RepID=UPI0008EE9B02|nr:hypothetical protein [Thiomicrospira sp. ALE5]SFR59891.1 hypothetical protein SAMN03092900_1544 [Thiomicrospira sp. ALE5]
MTNQDYLDMFDTDDEKAAVESIVDEIDNDIFSIEDALLDDINSIELDLESSQYTDEHAHNLDMSSDQSEVSFLSKKLADMQHQHQLQQKHFSELCKKTAPNWQSTLK